MKERVFQSDEQILAAAITESWNGLTSEDVQRVFHNWMEYLIWVIANAANTTNHKWLRLPLTLLDQEIAREAQDLFTPYNSELCPDERAVVLSCRWASINMFDGDKRDWAASIMSFQKVTASFCTRDESNAHCCLIECDPM
jgi:hypothetical protein